MSSFDESPTLGSGGSEREKSPRTAKQQRGTPTTARVKPRPHLNINLNLVQQQQNEKSHSADDAREVEDKLSAIPTRRFVNKWRQSARELGANRSGTGGQRLKLAGTMSVSPGVHGYGTATLPLNAMAQHAQPVPTAKLPNALIEMCVVVGMDSDTGLKVAKKSMSCASQVCQCIYFQF